MKYKKLMSVVLIIIIVISIFCISVHISSKSFEVDNSAPISIAFNKRYNKAQIKLIEDRVLPSNFTSNDIDFGFFNIIYNPTVIRETEQGYYAVLVSKDNSFCFVFWNFENEIYSIYRTNGFVSSEVFCKSIDIGETTLNDMKKSGLDYFGYPSSKMIATAHICTDGLVVVDYNNDFVAVSVDTYTNEDLTESGNFFTDVVPYILPKDKNSG